MTKFGELINSKIPVLIDFYTHLENKNTTLHSTLRDVAAALGEKAKIIKIDIEKNKTLANALQIKGVPTFMIYKDGEMMWRQYGEQDANTLINLVEKYIY